MVAETKKLVLQSFLARNAVAGVHTQALLQQTLHFGVVFENSVGGLQFVDLFEIFEVPCHHNGVDGIVAEDLAEIVAAAFSHPGW
jgi:hypothetical protein